MSSSTIFQNKALFLYAPTNSFPCFQVCTLLYMWDGLLLVMYALVFKDELLIEWQAEGIEEAIRGKEDILSMENASDNNDKIDAMANKQGR